MSFVNAYLLAVDPGDTHVGVAQFVYNDKTFEGRCTGAAEFTPEEFLDGFADDLLSGTYDTAVVERFILRPDLAMNLVGTEMDTSQMIGVIKFLVRRHNLHADAHTDADRPNSGQTMTCLDEQGRCVAAVPWGRRRPKRLQLALQPAGIQEVAAGHLRARGVKSVAKQTKAGEHCLSAELHGHHWLSVQAERVRRADQADQIARRNRRTK